MKRTALLWMAASLLAGLTVTVAGAQSLGDYARAHKKDTGKKAAAKQFDNDNLPTTDKLSIVGQAPAAPDGADADANKDAQNSDPAANTDQNANADEAAKKAEKEKSDEEKKKAQSEWASKIATQKDKIEQASKELDLLQREYRLRAAAFYADAGNRLRGSAAWDQEDAQFKRQIADKQSALDKEKTALDDLQEQARKAGVPPGARE